MSEPTRRPFKLSVPILQVPQGHSHEHAHGEPCTHDHGHNAHEHAADDHAAHDHAGHDHSGHDHGGHEHAAHDHHHVEQPPTHLPAEDGGAAVQLDVEALLPGETDEKGRFAELDRALLRLSGVTDVHLRGAGRICVHYDPAQLSAEALLPQIRQVAGRISKRFLHQTWMVRDMDAAQCAMVIEHVLRRTPGVLSAEVAYAAERLVVEFDSDTVSARDIEKKVAAIGYGLETPVAGHACSHHGHACGLAPQHGLTFVGVAGVGIALGWGLELAGLPALASTLCYAAALLIAGWYPTKTALGAVRQGRIDIETLMILAAVGAGVLGAWFEGAFLIFLFSLGHALEHRAMERARQAVESLAKLRPDKALVRRDGVVTEVTVAAVQRGDVLVVRPGDRVALDGVVRDGTSNIDQAAITGESVPVAKAAGDGVFAGTVNLDGTLEVEVTRLGGETTLARLVDLVAEAEARKSKVQRFTSRMEQVFVPVVLIAAPLLTGVLLLMGLPWMEALLRGVSLLVAASPCALAISTPAAVLSAVARAARGGVLIKGGAHLDALGTAKIIAFDKTGTLTVGKPQLTDVIPTGADVRELLGVASGVEALSGHPLAKAVVAGCKERRIMAMAAEDLEAIHGRGVRATVSGEVATIGNRDLFPALPAAASAAVDGLEKQGRTPMIVGLGDRVLGVLGVADTLRPEAKEAVAALRALGVQRVLMLSGDARAVADAVGAQVGVDEVHAPLLPEDKVRQMRSVSRDGVAMVGDGVNDAPALAAAAVGVSLGGAGSDVALETADVVLMGDDLRRLSFAVGLSRASAKVVRQNVTIAIGVSVVLVVASIIGAVEISEAVVLHEGSTLLVVFNGLRLLRYQG